MFVITLSSIPTIYLSQTVALYATKKDYLPMEKFFILKARGIFHKFIEQNGIKKWGRAYGYLSVM